MRRLTTLLLAAVFCLSLTACGPRDHNMLAGSVIGAGVGTVGAAVVDGHPLVGALVGAGAGALIGSSVDHHSSSYRPAPSRPLRPAPPKAHRPSHPRPGHGMPPRHGHR